MVQGLMAFAVAALMALVAVSGSQDRASLRVTSDAAVLQAAEIGRDIH
ncbi:MULTISPECIES: hypothetical protein [unclassified Yoonia]